MKKIVLASALVLIGAAGIKLFAHCQIPCGIYDDKARLVMLEEHVTTIAKSMKEIKELSKEEKPNWNQIVRWVNNKEKHADELTEIVTYYFMAQRIKPADPQNKEAFEKYIQELTLLHGMVVHAMKAKQTTDSAHVDALSELIHQFGHSYLGEK
ncbi:MAG: superoxide dismutase, Ni [Planctomycetes bacterium]|nr:superoxide dismutase, Ni [Planctomycetota bacterium]